MATAVWQQRYLYKLSHAVHDVSNLLILAAILLKRWIFSASSGRFRRILSFFGGKLWLFGRESRPKLLVKRSAG
jgi:hypothetical protein